MQNIYEEIIDNIEYNFDWLELYEKWGNLELHIYQDGKNKMLVFHIFNEHAECVGNLTFNQFLAFENGNDLEKVETNGVGTETTKKRVRFFTTKKIVLMALFTALWV